MLLFDFHIFKKKSKSGPFQFELFIMVQSKFYSLGIINCYEIADILNFPIFNIFFILSQGESRLNERKILDLELWSIFGGHKDIVI